MHIRKYLLLIIFLIIGIALEIPFVSNVQSIICSKFQIYNGLYYHSYLLFDIIGNILLYIYIFFFSLALSYLLFKYKWKLLFIVPFINCIGILFIYYPIILASDKPVIPYASYHPNYFSIFYSCISEFFPTQIIISLIAVSIALLINLIVLKINSFTKVSSFAILKKEFI